MAELTKTERGLIELVHGYHEALMKYNAGVKNVVSSLKVLREANKALDQELGLSEEDLRSALYLYDQGIDMLDDATDTVGKLDADIKNLVSKAVGRDPGKGMK